VDILEILRKRFTDNLQRHKDISWESVFDSLQKKPEVLAVIKKMEETGGQPDVIGVDSDGLLMFADCSGESPGDRRSLCYDRAAWESRKTAKPISSVEEMVRDIGAELMDEADYAYLQTVGTFDVKTSSWLKTPIEMRARGGALFGDSRYGRTFFYHNGAESYYASRGFRTIVRL
jgi:hypothetical protein